MEDAPGEGALVVPVREEREEDVGEGGAGACVERDCRWALGTDCEGIS